MDRPEDNWHILGVSSLISAALHIAVAGLFFYSAGPDGIFSSRVASTPDEQVIALQPMPELLQEEEDQGIEVGIAESDIDTENWLGFADPTPHEAPKSSVEQPELAQDPGERESNGLSSLPPSPPPVPESAPSQDVSILPLEDEVGEETESPADDPTEIAVAPNAEPREPDDAVEPAETPKITTAQSPDEAREPSDKTVESARSPTHEEPPSPAPAAEAIDPAEVEPALDEPPMSATEELDPVIAPVESASAALANLREALTESLKLLALQAAQATETIAEKTPPPPPPQPPATRPFAPPAAPTPSAQPTPARPTMPALPPSSNPPAIQSEKESSASSKNEPISIVPKAGRTAARQGLEIITRRVSFQNITLASARPRNPVVAITFGRDGSVITAKIIKSSGAADVDEPVLNSIYGWRAVGKDLESIPLPSPNARPGTPPPGLTIEMRIILLD